MEYFVLEVASEYNPPYPLGWYEKFGTKAMEAKDLQDMSRHEIFLTKDNMQMVFTDIICFPCFMVSKVIRDTIWLYDSSIFFYHIILLSKEQKRSETYYIPVLDKVNCISEKSVDDLKNKCDINNISIVKEKIQEKAIFRAERDKNSYIFISMDLANSILRRETVGIGLKATKCI